MKKFIYMPYKGKQTIYECEVTQVHPTPHECKNGEQLYLVLLPDKFKGEKWYSQFMFDCLELAQEHAAKMITIGIDLDVRKKNISLTDSEREERFKIEVEML